MKNLFMFALLFGLISCSSLKTSYDYDKQANFASLKTYNYTEETLNLPVHQLALAVHGIFLLENMNLEALAAHGVYEFALLVQPLKIKGGTGSTVAPVALF